MVPRAVLMKSGLVSLNAVRQVNTAHTKTTVNGGVNAVKTNNVNTARPKVVVNVARLKAVVNVVKGNNVNDVKASAYWVWKPKTKFLDHVSKHNSSSITLNKFDYIDCTRQSLSVLLGSPKEIDFSSNVQGPSSTNGFTGSRSN
ncbi:hypothetical protein Tco_0752961 [Tanacetum coccineum]